MVAPSVVVGALEPIEREVRAVLRDLDAPLPGRDRGVQVALLRLGVAEVQIRRDRRGVQVNRRLEPALRVVDAAVFERLQSELVLEERQNQLRLRLIRRAGNARQAPARHVRLLPLVLVFLQLLQIEQRRLVVGVELQHFGEHRHRPVHETAAPVVEPEAEQHVRRARCG